MSFVVGLTGGIGSGKSAVTDRFAARGAAVVDTDLIAHALTAPGGAGIAPIRAAFGDALIGPDGALDRAAMRRLVFANPKARHRLEAILHPLIRQLSDDTVRRLTGGGGMADRRPAGAEFPYVVLVVPLLVETGSYRDCVDRICVVDCPEETQIARVMARSGLPRAEAQAILAAQARRADRLAAADDIIDNGGDLVALNTQMDALHARYLVLAEASRVFGRNP